MMKLNSLTFFLLICQFFLNISSLLSVFSRSNEVSVIRNETFEHFVNFDSEYGPSTVLVEVPDWLRFEEGVEMEVIYDDDFSSSPKDLFLSGDLLYIAYNLGKSKIYNVSDPFNPWLVSRFDDIERALSIFAVDDVAYAVEEMKGLYVFDISDPHEPTVLGMYNSTSAREVVIEGNYAFLANSTSLEIIDVSNPLQPSLASVLWNRTNQVFMSDDNINYVYICNDEMGILIVDVSTPTNPSVEGVVHVEYDDAYEDPRCGVFHVRGDRLYHGRGNSGDLQIFDISVKSNPVMLHDHSGICRDVGDITTTMDDKWLYLSCATFCFRIVDFSDATVKGTTRSGSSCSDCVCNRMVCRDTFCFVTPLNRRDIVVYNASKVDEGTMYPIADSGERVKMFDVYCLDFDPNVLVDDRDIRRRYCYVSSSGGLRVYDVTDKKNITFVRMDELIPLTEIAGEKDLDHLFLSHHSAVKNYSGAGNTRNQSANGNMPMPLLLYGCFGSDMVSTYDIGEDHDGNNYDDSPKFESFCTLSSMGCSSEYKRSMMEYHDGVVVTVEDEKIGVVNVSSVSSPEVLGEFDAGDIGSGLDIEDFVIYVTSYNKEENGKYIFTSRNFNYIHVFDISDPSNIQHATGFAGSGIFSFGLELDRETGRYLYETGWPNNGGFSVMDVSNVNNIQLVSSIPMTETEIGGYCLFARYNFVLFADMFRNWRDPYIGFVDVTDPENPKLREGKRVRVQFSHSDESPSVFIDKDNYMYLADGYNGFRVIRVNQEIRFYGQTPSNCSIGDKNVVKVNATDMEGSDVYFELTINLCSDLEEEKKEEEEDDDDDQGNNNDDDGQGEDSNNNNGWIAPTVVVLVLTPCVFFCCCFLLLLLCMLCLTLLLGVFCCICLFLGGSGVVVVKNKVDSKMDPIDKVLRGDDDDDDFDPSKANIVIQKGLFEIEYEQIKVIKKIGTIGGSSALIFHCKWKKKDVAFKCFHTKLLFGNEDLYKEFEREAEVMSSLLHPNILTFYGCCLQPPRVGIVMEYCKKGDLAAFLKKNPKMEVEQKIKMLRQVCDGFEYLHDRNVIHRDVKPANILLNSKDIPKIIDFGLSKICSPEIDYAKTKRVGTSYYMAPEVVLGSQYSVECDVFSFSIVVWQVVTSHFDNPFEGHDATTLEFKIANDENFRPDCGKIPYEVRQKYKKVVTAMRRSWDKDPQKRPTFAQWVKLLDEDFQ